ncbi:hypothetical protein BKP35_17230 [Anaerobacillus arseniciselenatis]|uniref:Uncharacterized protein n=2 Tax=Anaerobacillus arseniciselenatis TaxID=85682 RepID=A0A1S2LAA4_9BACI|nr:hypothetical protein BKP35_17230 [Anaerobacillus arseniciselenatis]
MSYYYNGSFLSLNIMDDILISNEIEYKLTLVIIVFFYENSWFVGFRTFARLFMLDGNDMHAVMGFWMKKSG